MYYNVFSMGFLGFSVVMWAVGAGVLHGSKQRGGGKDIWGWSCNDNVRHDLFQGQVSYDLVCRFQVSVAVPFRRFFLCPVSSF